MEFYKYHSLGNDYLVYDCNKNQEVLDKEKIVKLCNRNYGIGADGIVEGPYEKDGKMYVKVYNADGSEAEQGGNAIRIFAHYLKKINVVQSESFSLYTRGGEVELRFLNRDGTRIQMTMGQVSFDSEKIGLTGPKREALHEYFNFGGEEYECICVSVGNPHCVIIADEISRAKVCGIGKYSEGADYFPERINTQLVKVLDKNNIQIEIYERGVGYTLSSGTCSCAAAGAAYKLGLIDSDVMVHTPGGKLWTQIDENLNVKMIGSVKGICRIELFEDFFRQM